MSGVCLVHSSAAGERARGQQLALAFFLKRELPLVWGNILVSCLRVKGESQDGIYFQESTLERPSHMGTAGGLKNIITTLFVSVEK